MNTKNIAPNRPIDGTKFLELLTTVSLNEVLRFEFRKFSSQKWQSMVLQEQGKYQCNCCNVVQWGEKNLFSHLSGKKHNALLIGNPQWQIRIKPLGAPKQAAGNKINSPSISKNQNTSNTNKVQNKNDNNVAKPAANTSGNVAPQKATPNAAGGNNQANRTLQSPGMKKGPNLTALSNTNKNTGGSNNLGQKAQPQVKPQSQPGKPNTQAQKEQNQPQKAQSQPQKEQPQQKEQSQQKAQSQPQKAQAPQQTQSQTKPPQGQQRTQQGQGGMQQSNSKKSPDIVKNPLATKITCVPLANLISATPEPVTDDNNDVIIIDEDQPAEGDKNLAGPKNLKPNQAGPSQAAPNQAAPKPKPMPNQAATKQPVPNQSAPKQNMPNQGGPKNPTANQGGLNKPMANQAGSKQKSTPPNHAGTRNILPIQRLPSKNAVAPVRSVPAEKVIAPSSYGGPGIPRAAPSYPGTSNKPTGITFDSNSHQDEIMKLVGVEYVLKIVRSLNDLNIRYLCCLCEITVTEQSMHNHLLGYNHRLKYFDKHYPTAMRQFRQYVSNVPESDVCKIMIPIFDKLALAIETHHGRKTPFQCYEHFFAKDRQSLISKAFNRFHASEKVGPSFTHVVDAQEVDELIKNARSNTQCVMNMENPNPYMCPPASNYAVGYQNMPVAASNVPSNTVDDETHKRMVENFLRDTRQSSGDNQKSRSSKRSRSKSPQQRKRVATTNPMKNKLWNLERWSVSPLREGDIWQAYRHMVDMKVRELNNSFATYKSDPEQHPNYQSEWQMFWKRRKDELVLAGINHRSYNYQNEWIHFFNNRLEELYDQDIENIKVKCRERLCLPMTNNELSNKKYHVNVPEPPSSPVITHNEPVANRDVQKMSVDEETEAPPNVIHVLRLLTALEDYLGSLGPFITEMLAKALQAQKLYPEQIHSLTLTAENCAILETAKEKFTGLLISQIYDPTKERALKKAISDTELLLEVASKYTNPKDTVALPIVEKQTPQIVNRIQQNVEKPLNKTELAAKLASSLVSQGKTSINREELQKILQVYTMIEQKKRQDIGEAPSNSGNYLPSNLDNQLRSNSGNHLHNNSGYLPSNSGNNLPSYMGNNLPRDSGNYASNYSENSLSPVRPSPLISNPINNDNLLTQHSARNLNVANNASNTTSMYTGQNYPSNVARFNNQNTNSITNTTSAFSADRGLFGSGVLSSSTSSYQNSQFGTGPSLNPTSSVLRNDISTSSLFNFNTHLNPTYNNTNTSRRNF
ncbi:uncharacterized protein [Drosophila kikkawai]|uniref:U1-type domain-containing protein n=1 Tax=Drosophila kikkawai TaxID=30033 RepID=A0A6P4IDD2_DROKI|nr:uncharacterized protein LOC108073425 [Drosophila kikkawai]